MKTIHTIIAENPDATAEELVELHNAQPPEPKASSDRTRITYLWIGDQPSPLGINVAGAMKHGLEAWIAGINLSQLNPALPSPDALSIIHQRLLGAVGLDMTSANAPGMLQLFSTGVEAAGLAPVISPEHAQLFLSIGWTQVNPATVEQVEFILARNAKKAQINALRDRVNGLTDALDDLDRRWQAGEEFSVPTFEELLG